jgi:type II secretory pathway pseudopilin PulG
MRQVASVVITVLLVTSLGMAQGTGTGKTGTRGTKSGSSSQKISAQLSQMQQSIDAQQQQIQELMQQLQSRDQQIQQLQQQMNQVQSSANQAQEKADTAVSQSTQQKQDVVAVRSDVTDLKDSVTNTALAMQETQKAVNESPLALRIKGITLTPGGFLAAETVWRERGLASDVNTPFNSIPLPGSSQSSLSEFFASGRQSRVSLLAEGKLKDTKLTGYFETDFLSAGVTSNNNESNSYSMRQRQVWGQASLHGWSFTGGQMWSLVTETRKGVDNRTEALPMTIDAQYHVGFSWARQYGFRVAKDFGDKVWLAFSVENPQTTFTAHGNASNFLLGAPGTGGGLYNPTANYSFNSAPDIIAKAAFEPGWGHYEVFGVVSQFRDRVFPNGAAATPSAASAFNDSRVGGGIGANARGSLFHKHVDVGLHFLGGDGVGRYGTTGLPDATVRPDGTLALVRAYQALGTLEWHSAKWDIYTNAGGEYAARTAYLNSAGKGVGYGSTLFSNAGCSTETLPGSNGFTPGALTNCTGDTRNIIQGTFGFWYRFYKGPKGTVQWGPQYSYVVRNTWSGTAGSEPHGIENMFFTSFRYYLP